MLFFFFPVDFTLIYKFITNHFVAYIKKTPQYHLFFLLISKGNRRLQDFNSSVYMYSFILADSGNKNLPENLLILWKIGQPFLSIAQKIFQEIINLLRCYFLLSFYLVLPLRVYVTVFGYHVSISCKADPKLKLKFAILMFSFKMIQNITNKNKMFNSCSMR